MKVKLKMTGFMFALLSSFCVSAQDFSSDMLKIRTARETNNYIVTDVLYKYFSDPSDIKPSDTLIGHLISYHDNYLYSINKLLLVRNDKYLLTVDNMHRDILVADAKKQKIPFVTLNVLDSIANNKNTSIVYKPLNSTTGSYEITLQNENAYQYTFIFDRNTYHIVQIDIYYHRFPGQTSGNLAHPKLSVYYMHYRQSQTNQAIFSEANYVTIQKNSIKPISAYSAYKVFNDLKP